jgi:hypothetical protein
MESTAEKFYKSLYSDCNETSKMFRFIPIFFIDKKSSKAFYYSLIIIVSIIELNFRTYFLGYILAFVTIAEHRRIILTRETVLDMCMIDEVYYEWESKQNEDFLNETGMNIGLTDSDRCEYFYERLSYVDCVNTTNYIKRHYKFLLSIVASYIVIYLGSLVYPVFLFCV